MGWLRSMRERHWEIQAGTREPTVLYRVRRKAAHAVLYTALIAMPVGLLVDRLSGRTLVEDAHFPLEEDGRIVEARYLEQDFHWPRPGGWIPSFQNVLEVRDGSTFYTFIDAEGRSPLVPEAPVPPEPSLLERVVIETSRGGVRTYDRASIDATPRGRYVRELFSWADGTYDSLREQIYAQERKTLGFSGSPP